MCPLDLVLPARPDVDLTVGRVHAVADDEVVSQAVIPMFHLAMIIVHAFGRVDRVGGMMDDDRSPLPAADSAGGNPLPFIPRDSRLLERGRLRRLWGRGGDNSSRRRSRRTENGTGIGRASALGLRGATADGRRERASPDCRPFHKPTSYRRCIRAWSRRNIAEAGRIPKRKNSHSRRGRVQCPSCLSASGGAGVVFDPKAVMIHVVRQFRPKR